jgi:DNA modification methylase
VSPINYGALGALDPRCRFIVGDCRASLASLEAESVQACVTSPPYFGLRNYGDEGQKWPVVEYATLGGVVVVPAMQCPLGLEPTPAAFVGHLVLIFREARRVLRNDGTVWLNLGDSYNNRTKIRTTSHQPALNGFTDDQWRERAAAGGVRMSHSMGAKEKDLLGIPWMVAFALRADGWYLRADIIWHKPNPMPESVCDRPTKAHEYIFLLSKSKRYFYDADAIKEAATHGERFHGSYSDPNSAFDHRTTVRNGRKDDENTTAGRNKRSVWTVAPKPFPGVHFATFPPKLIEPCILAGCPEGGTVLDPFAGAGTTGMVALRHSRSFVGCEINDEYVRLAQDRIIADQAPAKKKRARKTPVAA